MRELLLMAVLFFQQQPAAPPTGAISGRLLDWDRTPVAGTRVLARPAVMTPGVMFHESFTDPSGAFRFEGVVSGSYHIVTGSIYYPGVVDRDAARVVTITGENLAVGGLEFVLPVPPPGVRVTGRVIVPENTILAEDQRVLSLAGGRRIATARIAAVLHGVAFVSSFEVPVSPDGSFAFSKIPQGTYAPTLTGDVVSGLLTPSAIVIAGKELTGVEIAAPRRNARLQRPTVEAVPTGTEISELGRASSEGASESAAVASLRTINTAEVTYLSVSNGNYGTLQNLIDAGLLDQSFLRAKAGYAFSVVASGPEYNATAVPAAGGRFGLYSTPDAVVRYSLAPILSPPREGGKPYGR